MEKSREKSKTVAFLGKYAVRYKIIVDNKCLQQLKSVKYLGCEISYGNEKDVQQKTSKICSNAGNYKKTLLNQLW